MRILHILQPPVGGAETVVRLLVRAQAGRHQVGVVCDPAARLSSEAQSAGAGVWTLRMAREVGVRDARRLVCLAQIVHDFGPDVIHAHTSKAGVLGRIAGRALGVPVVYSPHNFAYRAYEGGRLALSFFLGVERVLAPLTSFLHMTCDDEYRDALARGLAKPGRCATVHTGVDVAEFADLSLPSPKVPTVGTYARLYPQKAVANLIRAAATLRESGRNFNCVVVGGGPLLDDLKRLTHELALDSIVRFDPDPGSAREALSHLDIFVLPSHTETFPLGLMEAMAAGRAVVATAVGGVPEMIRPGVTGLLVPSGDPGALAAAMATLLDDKRLRRELGRAARADAVRRFDYTRMAERLERVYREVLLR